MKYYVYRHIRLDTNTPFYVGKGSNNRAFQKYSRNKLWKAITKNRNYKVEILKYFDDEISAFKFEEKLITLYKSCGYCKANICVGGGGVTGYKHSQEQLQKIKMSSSGSNNGMFGKSHTEESKIKNLKSNGCKKFIIETVNGIILSSWLSKKSCAEHLGVSTNTVRGYLKTQKLMKSKQIYFRYKP